MTEPRSANLRPIDAILITCEHAGNLVPARYRRLFRSPIAQAALATHRGYDIGALPMARAFAGALGAPLVAARVTRLLVDCNRSPTSRSLFSEFARPLSTAGRHEAILAHHLPHRSRVERIIRERIDAGQHVLQLAVHTFTPVLRGQVRRADIGFLYDPARPSETSLAAAWRRDLKDRAPDLVVRLNYPYRGVSDGLPTTLRRLLPPDRYLGIELEVNQRFFAPRSRPSATLHMQRALIAGLTAIPSSRD